MSLLARIGGGMFALVLVCALGGCGGGSDATASAETAAGSEGQPASQSGTKTGKQNTNQLAGETSPYLLLHAHNPVNWHPWSPEAFEKAKKEGKPIFLSVGYSSCYWCHVMERLVFSNEKIASYMNEHFVNIKVDREERPDVDDIYMTSLHVYFKLMESKEVGGWPLSMFLTPEGKPFAGGTYFPPEDENGRMGFPKVMQQVAKLWKDDPESIRNNAEVITEQVQQIMKPQLSLTAVDLNREMVSKSVEALLKTHDEQYGGIDFNAETPDASKFPTPAKLALLEYAATHQQNAKAAEALDKTLARMAAGGIHDQLGGGFHRYSTDRYWHVPHFEKMLYDQAQMAELYANAYARTSNPLFAQVAAGTLDFVLRELTDPAGGFYSALDAETDGVEGKFYVWTKEEVEQRLGPDASLFKTVYGLEEAQVFEHGYVLHRPPSLDDAAKQLNVDPGELREQLARMRSVLFEARNEREPLKRDDKVLSGWNGLMIRALARSGKILNRPEYVAAAEDAAVFIMMNMRDENGQLLRSYRQGDARLNGYLDDYAFVTSGMMALFDATGDEKWLNAARRLTDDQINSFWDEKGKGFYFTSHGHEQLIARTKNAFDSVLPSGSAVVVRNLADMAAITSDPRYFDYAGQTLELFAANLQRTPSNMAQMAIALGEYLDAGGKETSGVVQPAGGSLQGDTSGIEQTGAQSNSQDKKSKELVAGRIFFALDKLPPGKSCDFIVLLDIQENWHINANPASEDYLIPTSLAAKSKLGTELANVHYPKGHQATMGGFDEPISVYDKRIAIRGTLQVPANATSAAEELQIVVRYQACNDKTCLIPKTLKLAAEIPVARPGEPVQQINQKLFAPPRKQ